MILLAEGDCTGLTVLLGRANDPLLNISRDPGRSGLRRAFEASNLCSQRPPGKAMPEMGNSPSFRQFYLFLTIRERHQPSTGPAQQA